MKRVHIIGRKNHGKTTLIVDLVKTLSRRGLRVGTIKHTHHDHELDTPGKDSHRHKQSGASVVGICSPSMNAVFWSPSRESKAESEEKYATFVPMQMNCDVVLVEGDTQTDATKIEVWRREIGTPPIAESDPSVAAVVTDDSLDVEVSATIWQRSNIDAIADQVIELSKPT